MRRLCLSAALSLAMPLAALAQGDPTTWYDSAEPPAGASSEVPWTAHELPGAVSSAEYDYLETSEQDIDAAAWNPRAPHLRQPIYTPRTPGQGLPVEPVLQSPDVPILPNPTPIEEDFPENFGDAYAPQIAPGQEYYYEAPPPGAAPVPAPPPAVPPLISFPTRVSATWLPGGGDDIGWFDLDLRGKISPADSRFSISPGFGVHWLNGPSRTDLPGQLYDVYAEFRFMTQVSRQMGIELAITPGWFSDGDSSGSDAIRIPARAVGFYYISPFTQIVFGVAYLDREDIRALPVIGIIHAPNDDVRLELVFPRPKLARRIVQHASYSRWAYLAGEFGGGSWAIERRNGRSDIVSYSDWRLIGGLESKHVDNRTWFGEVGFVFNRELEYESGRGNFEQDPTAMFRLGMTY